MKAGVKFGGRMLGYYTTLTVLSVLFLSMIQENMYWLQVILNVAILAGFAVLLLNDGGYNGEKACSLTVSLERRRAEGHAVPPESERDTWKPKVAVIALLTAALPLLLLSVANLVYEPVYDRQVSEYEAQYGLIADLYPQETVQEGENAQEPAPAILPEGQPNPPTNWVMVVTRLCFMPFIALYPLFADAPSTLHMLFVPLSFLMPAFGAVGYLMGPKLRQKKLDDIAKGVKRKKRNLKVNKKPKGPHEPKREV